MTPAGSLSAAPDTMPGPMTRKNCRHDRRWCSRRARALVATAHTVRSLQAAGARSLLPPRGRPRKHTRPAALDAPPASLLRSRYPRSRLRDIQVAFVGTRPLLEGLRGVRLERQDLPHHRSVTASVAAPWP